MEKHIQLVAVLNIVYRAWVALWGTLLVALGVGFDTIFDLLVRERVIRYHDIPAFVLDLAPLVLIGFGVLVLIVSVAALAAGIGVLHRREWGRILLLVVSFINLLRFPLGTVLGGYSIWVLLNDETIRSFTRSSPAP